MKKVLALALACAAMPAGATVVTLNFQGSIPQTNSHTAAGADTDFTDFQKNYIYAIHSANGSTPGTSYDFTLSYDTAATATGGKFPVTFSKMLVNGVEMSNVFTPYIAFQQAGAYKYMNITLQFTEVIGTRTFQSYAFMSLGDNDGDIGLNVLPLVTNPLVYDFVNVSFEVYERKSSYRT